MTRALQRMFAFAVIAVLVFLAARSIAAEVEYHAEAGAAYGGFDSNPSRAETAADRDGLVFYPLELDAEARMTASPSFELRAEYGFHSQFYERSSFNESDHHVRLQQEWDPRRRSRFHGLRIRFREEFERQNQTYHSRGNDEELEIALASGELVNLGGRFDYNEYAASSRVTYDWTRWLETWAEGRISRRDYWEDYSQYEEIYSLDQNRWSLTMLADAEIAERVKFSVEYDRGAQDYDEKFGRDISGAEMRAVPARFHRDTWTLRLRRWAPAGFRGSVFYEHARRTDENEGYWNYDTNGFGVDAGWAWERGHRVSLGIRTNDTDYQYATVGYDPTAPLRAKGNTVFEVGGTWRLSSTIDFEMDLRMHDRDNNSPGFAYERTTIISGFRYRY